MTAEYGSGRYSPVFTSSNVTTATIGGAFSVPQTRTFWLYLLNEAGVSLPSPAVTVTAIAGGRISVGFPEVNRDAATGYKYCFIVASLTTTLDDAWVVGFWRLFQTDSDVFATAAPIVFSRDEQLVVPPAAVSSPAELPTGVSLVPGMVRLVSGGVASGASYYIYYPWLITDPNSPYFRYEVDGDRVIEKSPGEYWVRFGNPNFGLFPISGDISGDTGACRPLVAVDEEFLAQNLLFGDVNYTAADNTDSVATNAKGLTVFFGSDTGDDIAVGSRFGLNVQVDGFPATTLFDRRIVVRFLGYYNPVTGVLDTSSGLSDGASMAGIGVDMTQTNSQTGFLAISKTLPGNQKAVFKIFPRFRASEIYPPLVQGSVISIVPILLPQGGVRVPLASIFETSAGGFVAPIADFGRVVPGDGTLNVLPGLFVVRGHESALQPKQTIVQVTPNTLNQQLAITQDGRAVVRGVAGVTALSGGEALLALFDFGTGESVASGWSNNIVLSAAGGIAITATYPISGAFGMVRSGISEIAGNTQAYFNPPQVRIYIKQGSTIYRLNSPQAVVIGTTQVFSVTDLTNTTVVAATTTPPFTDFCLFDPPTVSGAAIGGSLPIGTYQVAIAYSFLSGTQCTRIRQSAADGCIPAYRKSLFESNASPIIQAIELLSTAGLIERTAGGSAAIVQLGAFIRTLLDDATQSDARTTLGLGAAALRAIGNSTGQIRDAADSAYSNARTPTAHASTHNVGGTDPITVFGYLAVSANTALTTANQRQLIDINASSSAITITLPSAATVGSGWAVQIRRSDASANLVTISRSGSDTINGATTLSLAVQHQSLILFSLGGTSWGVVAGFSGTLPAYSLLGTGATAGIAGVISSNTFAPYSAIGNDPVFATTIANLLALKAPLNSPTFTGNVGGVTAAMVGLGSVNNTSDTAKPISTLQQAALSLKADLVNGSVPASQLPSYVDDILEFANLAGFPGTGEAGKLYIALDTSLLYRWSGTVYAVIPSSLALGITSTTAYRGDYGNTAYNHSQITTGNPHQLTAATIGLGNLNNTSDIDKPISTIQQAALDLKAPLLSPVFTSPNLGTPSAAVLTNATGLPLASGITGSLPAANGGVTTTAQTFTGAKTFSSPLKVTTGTGFIQLNQGSSVTSGYLEIYKSDAITRLGYIGFDNSNFLYNSENGANHIFNGGTVNISNTTQSTSTTTGAQVVAGGQAIGGNQYIGGFTSLGGNVATKKKKLTGTTASTQGATATVAHGLTGEKIISWTLKIGYNTNLGMPEGHNFYSGYEANTYHDATYFIVINSASNSGNILSRPFTLLVEYE